MAIFEIQDASEPFRQRIPYVNGVSESLFAVGLCLPAGPWVSDDDVHYIVDTIKSSIVK